MLKSLIMQLQTRYPTASLISELLTIHNDSYVVRALVQLGNTAIATGMASATTIENAEDRAKLRALEALGLANASSFMPNLAFDSSLSTVTSSPSSAPSPTSPSRFEPASSALIEGEPGTVGKSSSQSGTSMAPQKEQPYHFGRTSSEEQSTHSPDVSSPAVDATESFSNSGVSQSAIANSSTEELAADEATQRAKSSAVPQRNSNTGRARKPKPNESSQANESEQPIPTPAPTVDLSDAIAKTSVELKRLKWTEAQGRQHLQTTYGKRSRQHLSDEELLDFLQFLEQQESPPKSLE
jgi:hypothetical protein